MVIIISSSSLGLARAAERLGRPLGLVGGSDFIYVHNIYIYIYKSIN